MLHFSDFRMLLTAAAFIAACLRPLDAAPSVPTLPDQFSTQIEANIIEKVRGCERLPNVPR